MTDQPREPATEAGRALITDFRIANRHGELLTGNQRGTLARDIEAQAAAPLLARIAELEDAIRFGDDAARMAALDADDSAALERVKAEAVKHQEFSRHHVLWWSNLGRHCSEPNCEVNLRDTSDEEKGA